jgi:hypothetical protein
VLSLSTYCIYQCIKLDRHLTCAVQSTAVSLVLLLVLLDGWLAAVWSACCQDAAAGSVLHAATGTFKFQEHFSLSLPAPLAAAEPLVLLGSACAGGAAVRP